MGSPQVSTANLRADDAFWEPVPVLYPGATIFVLGSGPSLNKTDVDKLKGRIVIAANSACLLAPWAQVLFFIDTGWYQTHKTIIKEWPGIVVTMSRTAKKELPLRCHRVNGQLTNHFPKPGSDKIRSGRNSGQIGFSLAVAFGAAKVVGLGFDMRPVNGKSHFHNDYPRQTHAATFTNEFLPAFAGWNQQALDIGVQIFNATPHSALTEFPFVNLDEFLAREDQSHDQRSLSEVEGSPASGYV